MRLERSCVCIPSWVP